MTTEYVFCPKQQSKIHIMVCSKCIKEYDNCKNRIKKLNEMAIPDDEWWVELGERWLKL